MSFERHCRLKHYIGAGKCRSIIYFYADVDIGSHGSISYSQHGLMVRTKRWSKNHGNSLEDTGNQSRFV